MEQTIQRKWMTSLMVLCCSILSVNGFVSVTHTTPTSTSLSFQHYNWPPHRSTFHLHMTMEDESDDDNNTNDEVLFQSTVKIDDGGSDLTDRFKYKVRYQYNYYLQKNHFCFFSPFTSNCISYSFGYFLLSISPTHNIKNKVNALMGVFDPTDGKPDDENADGNILNAMMNFPMDYSFHVVGKINAGEEEDKEKLAMEYVEQVRQMVLANTSEKVIVTKVTPRANYKFVKVSKS